MDWKPTISSSCGNALIYYWTMITSCVCAKNATKKQMPVQYPLIFCDSLRKNETISPGHAEFLSVSGCTPTADLGVKIILKISLQRSEGK